jgi:hypothetical protein
MPENAATKHKILKSKIKTRKMQELRKNPQGTSLNGSTKNAPISLDNHELKKRERTLRDRKAIDSQRRRKSLSIKKKPLPVNQMEEFLGMKPVDTSQKREWNLDQADFLRFQSSARHSADDVKRSSSPISMYQLRVDNNENHLYKRFMKNLTKGPAPRFTGRYESSRPAPVRIGSDKAGPRSQGRYEPVPPPLKRPDPVRRGTKKSS